MIYLFWTFNTLTAVYILISLFSFCKTQTLTERFINWTQSILQCDLHSIPWNFWGHIFYVLWFFSGITNQNFMKFGIYIELHVSTLYCVIEFSYSCLKDFLFTEYQYMYIFLAIIAMHKVFVSICQELQIRERTRSI